MDNRPHTAAPGNHSGNEYWPFDSFYADLKKNGFSITTSQIIHANAIIIQYANWVKNERELCLFLTPVFATNEDEQLLFTQLFDKHFKIDPVYNHSTAAAKNSFSQKLQRHWKGFIILYSFLALILVVLIIRTVMNSTRIDAGKVSVFLVNKKSDTNGNHTNPVLAYLKEPLLIDLVYDYPDKKKEFTLSASYDWGDESPVGDKPSHYYESTGTYYLAASITVLYNNHLVKEVRLSRKVNVCVPGNFLNIEFKGNKDSILPGQSIKLNAHFNERRPPDYIEWLVDDSGYHYTDSWMGKFSTPGVHVVSCMAVYGTTFSPCSIQQKILFTVVLPNAVPSGKKPEVDSTINNQQSAVPVKEKMGSSLYPLYITMAIVFFLFFIFFIVLREREMIKLGNIKKAANEKYTRLTGTAGKANIPSIVPFRNKNYLPLHESELNQAAKQMRKRVYDNSSFLHIDKTIRNSINKRGMFQPVMVNRMLQTEWLVLIDENSNNVLEVKLFEYLTVVLKKQNILIDTYYFNKEPRWCYNSNERNGISLEKLFVKHQRHILVILGNGHCIIDSSHATLDSAYKTLLERWQYRAIITPIAYPDWGAEEKQVLLPQVPVFPADTEGILLLTDLLANYVHDADIISRLKQHGNFYSSAEIDFEDINALTSYCNKAHWAVIKENKKPVNILIQWIAALAVYPGIRWEMILAIGKAILVQYDKADQLSYSNLLRIVRISWIRQGRFSPAMRLELLKVLTVENEILVRETVLQLLEEIPAGEIAENDPAYKEKETQQVINEFSLYANDPSFYSGYRRSKKVFEKMWTAGIVHAPLKEYLTNKDNSWKTLINRRGDNNDEVHNVSMQEYFDATEIEETLLSKFYLWLGLISLIVALSSVFALRILYIWDNIL